LRLVDVQQVDPAQNRVRNGMRIDAVIPLRDLCPEH
jgi:hypothetical protein